MLCQNLKCTRCWLVTVGPSWHNHNRNGMFSELTLARSFCCRGFDKLGSARVIISSFNLMFAVASTSSTPRKARRNLLISTFGYGHACSVCRCCLLLTSDHIGTFIAVTSCRNPWKNMISRLCKTFLNFTVAQNIAKSRNLEFKKNYPPKTLF